MVPPPSQKGKFKPRKPAKKVRLGASNTGASSSSGPSPDGAASGTTATPTVAFAPSTDNSAPRGGRHGSGRGSSPNGGRGGRGGRGRGRGRTPIPSGRVFFTGAERAASITTSKRKSTAAATKTKSKQSETEEVVGQLETAIGTSKSGSGSKANSGESRSMDYEDDHQQDGQAGRITKGSFAMEGIMYDSDSSEEERRANRSNQQHSLLTPLELPFATQALPVGIGSMKRPIAYSVSNSTSADPVTSANDTEIVNQDTAEPAVSPFVDTKMSGSLKWEQDTWFLVQLPTRLPPLKTKSAGGPVPADGSGGAADETTAARNNEISLPASLSEVITPPVHTTSHDNKLIQTAPGRIGKIIVYKSGRTVLKLEGPEGTSPLLMEVNEGLTCGFMQQAVAIDPEEGNYVALGEVNKSIVVTPDLSSAMVAE